MKKDTLKGMIMAAMAGRIFGAIFPGEVMGIKSIIGIILILGALTVMIIPDNKEVK